MTKFLTKLITDKTPIINLEYSNISNDERKKIIDLKTPLTDLYIRNMYYKNGNWYYFKKDDINYGYPFYIIEELMGTYLAKKRAISTISYDVAYAQVRHRGQLEYNYGIASINFKKNLYEYCMLSDLLNQTAVDYDINNIVFLSSICINETNEEKFLNHLFRILALDIYMLQKDRCNLNLQFQIDKITNEFSIAPLYDFSNCLSKVNLGGLDVLKNVVVNLTDITIPKLCRKYPQFKEELIFWLDQSMSYIWDIICNDYCFNKDTKEYEMIKDYYQIKEESTKKYIKQVIKDIQK